MSSKRDDLQGIRGLAILAVILYHFIPKYFPNGYVGVDQFFILSGFLMAKILSKEQKISLTGVSFFYYRRMKRILPLYALFILLALVFSLTLFEKSVFDFNIVHAVRSLLFISNTETSDKNLEYERMLANAELLFTHTWSLSAEVQFYAIAPFMILISIYMYSSIFIAISLLTCLVSLYAFKVLYENEETKSFAFNSMVTRIWQFSLGIICCHITQSVTASNVQYESIPDEEKYLITEDLPIKISDRVPKTASSILPITLANTLIIISMIATLFTFIIPQLVLRLTVCISTTLLIYLGHAHVNCFLSMRPLVYLGDISYSLYLAHYPICVYIKQNYENNTIALFIGITASVLVAVLSTELYEQFYLQQSMKFIFSLCFLLYLLNFGLLYGMRPNTTLESETMDSEEFWKKPVNLTNLQLMGLNIKLNDGDNPLIIKTETQCQLIKTLQYWKYCKFDSKPYTGQNRLMLLGNSYARNIGRMFLLEKNCKEKAKDVYMLSTSACEVLEDTSPHWSACIGANDDHIQAVNMTRPDYLFIMTRAYMSMVPSNTTEDSVLAQEVMRINILEKMVAKKIFIFDALPKGQLWTLVKNLNKAIKDNTTLPSNESFLDKKADYALAKRRMRIVAEKCTKCEIIDVMPLFMKNNTFQFYDENDKLIHFVSNLHFTNYGLTKIRPMFSELCKRL